MLLNRSSIVVVAALLITIAFTLPVQPPAGAQSKPPTALFLPLVGVSVDQSAIPRPPSPMPTATPTHTPEPTATVPSPTPTDIPATATATTVPGRITGRITVNGQPLALGMGSDPYGPQIELHKRERGQWQKVANAVIQEDGRFAFGSAAPLNFGEAYRVWWDVDPDLFLVEWLTRWMSREIVELGPGEEVDLGTIEVADTIQLVQPENFSFWTLPRSFSWRGRSVAGESYRWTLARQCGHNSNDIDRQDVFQSEPLQRQSSFTLDGLPPGYQYETGYCWYVAIQGADGGVGWPVYYRHVTFVENLP